MKSAKKIFRWVAGVVGVLLLLLIVAIYFIISDRTLTRIANRFIDECVTVESNVGNVHLELLKSFPISRFSIRNVYVKNGTDTLAAIDHVEASVNARQLLRGYYIIPEVTIDGVRANVEFYQDGSSNIDVFRLPTSKNKSEKKSSGIENFQLGSARLTGNNKINYRDYRSGTIASIDGVEAEVSASRGAADGRRIRRRKPVDMSKFKLDSIPDFLSEVDFRKNDISLNIDSSITNFIREWHPKGKIRVEKGSFVIPAYPLRNNIAALDASFDGNVFDLHSLGVKSGSSQFILSGKLNNVFRLFSRSHSSVNLNLMMNAKRLNINEIMAALQVGEKKETVPVDTVAMDNLSHQQYEESIVVDLEDAEPELRTPLIVVPANVVANVAIGASRVNISSFDIDSLAAKIRIQERTIQISDVAASSPMGDIALEAYYASRTKQDISAGFDLALRKVTAEKIIDLIPAVGEMLPMLRSFTGKLECDITATTKIDTTMRFITPSLDGVFNIRGQNLRLDDFGKLKPIVQFLLFGRRDFKHVDELNVMGNVKDSRIEVYPFQLTIDKYTMALAGTQNFDKSFTYHVSMLKSPIPFRFGVKLFGDDFQKIRFRLGRSMFRKKDVIPDYSEEVNMFREDLVMAIDNVFHDNFRLPNTDGMRAYRLKDEPDEELTYEEINEIELMLISMEIEEQNEAMDAEIDALIAILEI